MKGKEKRKKKKNKRVASEVVLLNIFLLYLNDTISHLNNLCLPCKQIFNGDDVKDLIESGLKTQGLN